MGRVVPIGRNTCRVRLSVGGLRTSIVNFHLCGSGNRRISVRCSVGRGEFSVSHHGDNSINFGRGFPTLA